MSYVAHAKARVVSTVVSLQTLLPVMLGANVAALFALDTAYGIPPWVKLAATWFLAF